MKLSVILLCALASTSLAKPLLQGQFEAVSATTPDGKTVELGKVMLGDHGVWVRVYLIYEGDKLTIGTQRLELEDGVYRACEVGVSQRVTWSAKGYTVPVEAGARGRVTFFKTLTAKNQSVDERSCAFTMSPDTLEVIPGDSPKLRSSDGSVVTLHPFNENLDHPNWASRLPKKK